MIEDWVVWSELWRSARFDESSARAPARRRPASGSHRSPGCCARASPTARSTRSIDVDDSAVRLISLVDGLGTRVLAGVLERDDALRADRAVADRASSLPEGRLRDEHHVPRRHAAGARVHRSRDLRARAARAASHAAGRPSARRRQVAESGRLRRDVDRRRAGRRAARRRRRAAGAVERLPPPRVAARARGGQLPARAALPLPRLDVRPRRAARGRARGARLRRPRPRRRRAAAVRGRRAGRARVRQPRSRRRAARRLVRRPRAAPRGVRSRRARPSRARTSTSTRTTGR